MEYFIVLILLVFSAIFSGLTIGFFSLNKDDLERKAELGDKQAQAVFRLRKNGNLLLSTLLIGNVFVNSTLAIFLGSLASGIIAGVISTGLIVIFGEILPQAAFSRRGLQYGAKLAWIVNILIFIFYPITKPLAYVLDKILGAEVRTVYSKKELIKMIEDHEETKESDIDAEEERIMRGVLSYSDKTVQDIMTPRMQMFALDGNRIFDESIVHEIKKYGHSRIPVFQNDRDHITGILYVKDLILQHTGGKTINDVARKDIIFVDYNKKLDELLEAFKKTRHHMFVVLDAFGGIDGLVTIEDVIEEIIGAEIIDEYDKYADTQEQAIKEAKAMDVTRA